MIELRSELPSSSTITKPCIWYEIPIPEISSDFIEFSLSSLFVALQIYFHQSLGSCSAQPIFKESISISVPGSFTKATFLPDLVSTSEALIEELPISNPIEYI